MGLFTNVPIPKKGCVGVLAALLNAYDESEPVAPEPVAPEPVAPEHNHDDHEHEEKGVNNLLIHITLADEAAYFIETLELKLVENYFESYPFRVYDNSENMADKKSLKITLLVNGEAPESKDKAGTLRMVPTAVAMEAYLGKAATKPDLIINAGTCGGFQYNNAKIGDAILVSESFVSDSFIPIAFPVTLDNGEIIIVEPYKKYATDNIALTKLSVLAKELKLIEGPCGTGNSLDYVERDLERLQANGAFAKDMELHALAWIYQYNGIPLTSLKIVTDIVELEDPVGEQFVANLNAAAQSLNENLIKIIEYIKEHRDLLYAYDESKPDVLAFNNADLMFVHSMVPHHQQAITMADYALDPLVGASVAIINLATQIKGAQGPEIEQMMNFLKAWDKPMNMEMDMEMDGMLTLAELDTLKQLRGQEFDRVWLRSMNRHHEGGVMMANDIIKNGVNSEVLELAKAIIVEQLEEIKIMLALITQ